MVDFLLLLKMKYYTCGTIAPLTTTTTIITTIINITVSSKVM